MLIHSFDSFQCLLDAGSSWVMSQFSFLGNYIIFAQYVLTVFWWLHGVLNPFRSKSCFLFEVPEKNDLPSSQHCETATLVSLTLHRHNSEVAQGHHCVNFPFGVVKNPLYDWRPYILCPGRLQFSWSETCEEKIWKLVA
jgi:hypothetical protein